MSGKKQRKNKRACVDCHFISISQLQFGSRGLADSTAHNHGLGYSERDQVRRKEAITVEDENSDKKEKPFVLLSDLELVLTCYKKCWTELHPDVPNECYEFLVKTDRSDCIYFFKYRPSMTFEVADEHIKMESLQLKQNEAKVEQTTGKAKRGTVKKGKLKRGEKQKNIPDKELRPYMEQQLIYLKSKEGGGLTGGVLAKKIRKDIALKFRDRYGEKATYAEGTIKNMISGINKGKK